MARYGFIGAGMMGQEHLRNLALLDGVAVTGLADPDEGMRTRALQTQGGTARTFADYRELIADTAVPVAFWIPSTCERISSVASVVS